MKRTILGLVAAFAFVAVGEMKIGTINMVELVQLHPNHESNRTLVKATDKDYKAMLEKQQNALQELADEGKKAFEEMSNPMLSATAKAAAKQKVEGIQQKLLAGQQELRISAQRYQHDLTDLESRLLKIETDEIRAKVEEYAKKNGYDIIADSTMLAYSKKTLDVTDEILKMMKVDPSKRKTLPKVGSPLK